MSEPSLMDELKESIMEDEARELGLVNVDENYKILDANSANFFLKRLEELKAEEDEINEMCDGEIERFTQKVNTFRDNRLTTIKNTQNYFKKYLEQYAEEQLANSKKKSIKLPFGTLQFRKATSQYTYDDDKLLSFLKDSKLTNLVAVKETPNKAELKKIASVKDGKLFINNVEVEGVTVAEGTTSFDVKINS